MLLELAVGAVVWVFFRLPLGFFFGSFNGLFGRFRKGQHGKDFVEQVANVVAMLSGDWDEILDSQATEILGCGVESFGVDLVYREKKGLPVFCSRRARSMSGEANSVRPSTTMTIACASSSATRA